MPTRHIQLGKVIGAGLTRANASFARITAQMTIGSGTYYLGVYTTTLNNDGSIAAPTNNQVPVIELVLNNNSESDQLFNNNAPPVPGPVWVGLSTAENGYTATANTARIDVDINEYEIPPVGLSTVSNSGTANKLTIWTNPVGPTTSAITPHSLYDIFICDLNNSSGAQLYVMVFATPANVVIAGAVPVAQWTLPIYGTQGVNTVATGSLYLMFGAFNPQSGKVGWAPFQQGQALTEGAGLGATGLYTCCVIAISSTPTTLTFAASTAAQITARYL